MIFIGVALLVAAGLALLISADAGSFVGLTQQQTGQLVPLLVILIVIAGGLFTRRRRFAELFGGLVLWMGIFGVAIVGYTLRDDIQNLAGRVFGELAPGIAVVDSQNGTATFRRGMGGHFQVRASINGADIPLIFDTGASAVVLTAEDARKAGIDTDSLRYGFGVDGQRHGQGGQRQAGAHECGRDRARGRAGVRGRGTCTRYEPAGHDVPGDAYAVCGKQQFAGIGELGRADASLDRAVLAKRYRDSVTPGAARGPGGRRRLPQLRGPGRGLPGQRRACRHPLKESGGRRGRRGGRWRGRACGG